MMQRNVLIMNNKVLVGIGMGIILRSNGRKRAEDMARV